MTQQKIIFLGSFGTPNLGNECTLHAILRSARTFLPGALLECICPYPAAAAARHNIPTHQMSYRNAEGHTSSVRARHSYAVIRFLRRIFYRIPREVIECARAFRTLRGTSMLVMPGTGMLGAYGTHHFGVHYELVKWSIIAKLRGCTILFVSVGGGRLKHPLSRWLIKSALSLADYRSYRDAFSKEYLESIGFDTSGDFVYPDLAFSLPRPDSAETDDHASGRVIGIGVMDYYSKEHGGEYGERLYRQYLERVTSFVIWLLEHTYTVQLLIGDLVYDQRVRHDVLEMVKKRAVYEDGQLISEPVFSVEQLLAQLATTDIVVASRFHNVLLALMLNKPVISISYDEKNDSLMTQFGLAEYRHSIERIDVDELVKQFITLEESTKSVKSHIKHKVEEFRRALEAQYESIFNKRDCATAPTSQPAV